MIGNSAVRVDPDRNRGLRKDMREDIGQLRGDIKDLRGKVGRTARARWRTSKGCWKDCARPSPDGPRLALVELWELLTGVTTAEATNTH